MVDGKILGLSEYGVQVTKQTAQTLIKCLYNQEITAPKKYTYQKVGFSEYKGETIFKGSKAIGADAEYTGKLRISPKGSYKKYKKMLEEEVIGQIALEFILAVSVSGLIVDFVKEKDSLGNIVVHLVGQSSTGKTTSALLAVASGSAPDFMGDNFVFSFLDTQNSLMRLLPSSYPAVIDEGSLIGNKDMTQAMYSLSSGVEKKRLTKNLDAQDVSSFKTALILTSEKSILSQCNENSGLLVRNVEIDNVVYTKSAESSDIIKQTVRENYGFLVPMVAECLIKKGKDNVVKMIKDEADNLIARAKKKSEYNPLTERWAKQSAVILTALEILQEVLQLCLNKPAIIDFMEEHSLVKDSELVSMGKRVMDYLLQVISKNHMQFAINSEGFNGANCRGRIMKIEKTILKSKETATNKLLITREEFVRILNMGDFSDEKIVLKELKDLGYLKSQKDRYVSDIRIVKDIVSKGYVLYLPDKEGVEDGVQEEKQPISEELTTEDEQHLAFLDEEVEEIEFEDD